MANNKVDVDRVYQKVLALANKEQRGYITPQEFNLFADQAQLEIFESYFNDLKKAELRPKNDNDNSDDIELLNEKISIHRVVEGVNETSTAGVFTLNDNAYILTAVKKGLVLVERVDNKTLIYMEGNPLTKATSTRPVYVRINSNQISVYPTSITSGITIEYIKKPESPKWTYVVVNGKALYNAQATDRKDFDLHESEESELVMRILELSGISIKDPLLTQAAMINKENIKAQKTGKNSDARATIR